MDNMSKNMFVDFKHMESAVFSNKNKIRKECSRLEIIFEYIICYLAYPCVQIVTNAHNAVY